MKKKIANFLSIGSSLLLIMGMLAIDFSEHVPFFAFAVVAIIVFVTWVISFSTTLFSIFFTTGFGANKWRLAAHLLTVLVFGLWLVSHQEILMGVLST